MNQFVSLALFVAILFNVFLGAIALAKDAHLVEYESSTIQARARFDVVMISGVGFGYGSDFVEQSIASMEKPSLIRFHDFSHLTLRGKISDVLPEQPCDPTRGLIIYTTSWGTRKAHRLADQYFERCGRSPDLFIVLDGIQKPRFRALTLTPNAKNCVNFYQTRSRIHGNRIKGCMNFDLGEFCNDRRRHGQGLTRCHMAIHRSKAVKHITSNAIIDFVLQATSVR